MTPGSARAPAATSSIPRRDERIHALDGVRAVAMFLGILLHGACSFMTTFPSAAWPVRDARHQGSFEGFFPVIHGFRMHLFFLLAGYFGRLLYVRLGPVDFAKQRLNRIGVPFVVGLVAVVVPFLFICLWGTMQWNDPGEIALRRPPGAVGPPTAHLWFLQFLLIFYAVALLVARLARPLPAAVLATLDRNFERVLQTPVRLVAMVPLTVVFLWRGPFLGDAELPGAGFIPTLPGLAHYGLFFLVGWWLHRQPQWLGELQRFVPASLLVAVVALAFKHLILRSHSAPAGANYLALKTAGLACAGVYAWAMSFGVIGAFLRFAAQPKPWTRYLADGSYWCYLVHLPVMLYLQFVIAPWQVSAWAKFTLLIAATMAPLLLTYHYGVRYTWVGAMLNGPRRPVTVVT